AACDIVLNLRYPTVGESSGTLLRSLGLGRAVIVSDIGSFCEYPDDVCLKVPVDRTEEDTLFEYLSLLVSRPEVREQLGLRAREWVELVSNCCAVAERYAGFSEGVALGKERTARQAAIAAAASASGGAPPDARETAAPVGPEYIVGW